MARFRTIQTALQLAIGTVLLALCLRTFLVLGLVAPVQVAGSSMAPALRGPCLEAVCPDCGSAFEVGAEFAAESPFGGCPHCGMQRVPLAGFAILPSDRLWIDRTAFERRLPRRGEVVVARHPSDGAQLCVKRVVGLPGETVEIRQGDVWVEGRPWVKSLAEQRAVRQLVHVNGEPVTDDLAYNAGLSRRLNFVRDFMLSLPLEARGKGTLSLDLHDGRQTVRITIELPSGQVGATADGEPLTTATLSEASRQRLAGGPVLLELSNFDRQLLLAIDSRVELHCPLEVDAAPPIGTALPFEVGASGLKISLGELTVSRDIYYCRQAVGALPAAERVLLADDAYYLLGDNSPISVDSRSWGSVPARYLVGRPLGVR